ncbi:hypothetical protein V2G26_014367 [Clonostachys chloroleuca]
MSQTHPHDRLSPEHRIATLSIQSEPPSAAPLPMDETSDTPIGPSHLPIEPAATHSPVISGQSVAAGFFPRACGSIRLSRKTEPAGRISAQPGVAKWLPL